MGRIPRSLLSPRKRMHMQSAIVEGGCPWGITVPCFRGVLFLAVVTLSGGVLHSLVVVYSIVKLLYKV